jgi:dephospho-CoA kinase
MLRVGLTGSIGSGKSTVAALLREMGAEVVSADALGHAVMEPGQPVFDEIVRVFGPEVVAADGRLNRAQLAKFAFQDGRIEELNAIVHPAVMKAQWDWMDEVFRRNSAAVAVIESALLFEVERDAKTKGRWGEAQDWRSRIDRILVVTASDELKIARYASRVCPSGKGREAAEAEARHRLSHQIPDAEKASMADYVLENNSTMEDLRAQVKVLWQKLQQESNSFSSAVSLK